MNKKHGLHKHILYRTWSDAKTRCINPKHKSWEYYGGRGISFYQDWSNNFLLFYNWAMLAGWQRGLQLDRINNDGDYTPDNCRFVSKKVNLQNTRKVKKAKGYKKNGNGFQAYIDLHSKRVYLGTYKTKEEAHNVYLKARRDRLAEYLDEK